MPRKLLFVPCRPAALTACKGEATAPADARRRAGDRRPPPSATRSRRTSTPADFAELVKTLSSDEFEGRGPGSAGEEKTVDYIHDADAAHRPAAGQRRQLVPDVPMVETTADESHDAEARPSRQAARR